MIFALAIAFPAGTSVSSLTMQQVISTDSLQGFTRRGRDTVSYAKITTLSKITNSL